MFEFDNDAKEKNFSSKLALVELLCLWFCTRSHFYSLKTMSQIKLCKMEIYATWRIVQTRTNNDFGNCTGTFDTNKNNNFTEGKHHICQPTLRWVEEMRRPLKPKKFGLLALKRTMGQRSGCCALVEKKCNEFDKYPTAACTDPYDFARLFFFFSCICVWVCNIPPLFETGQIVKAKAIAFHFDDNIWLMSS